MVLSESQVDFNAVRLEMEELRKIAMPWNKVEKVAFGKYASGPFPSTLRSIFSFELCCV